MRKSSFIERLLDKVKGTPCQRLSLVLTFRSYRFSKMDSFYKKYNTLNKLTDFAFTYAGLMSKEEGKWFPLFTFYQITSLSFGTSLAIVELCIGSREVQDIVGTLSIVITASCSIVRALRFLTRKKQVINILERLEDLRLKILNDPENKHFIIDAENVGRKLYNFVFACINGFPYSSFIWFTLCDYLLDLKENHLVLKVWIPWSREKRWVNILTNIFLTIVAIPCSGFYVAIHSLEITFTLYASAYIKTLQNNLINKGIRNEEIYEHHKVIIQLIKDHNEVLSGIKYLEAQISPLMPCGFGYSFMRALKKHEISVAMDHYLRAIACLFPSGIACLCGQQVISQMEGLHEASYMSNWREEEPKVRKDLLMMMIRTTKTPTINYRSFVTFDHVLLAMVLQTVYSYLTLMANFDTAA